MNLLNGLRFLSGAFTGLLSWTPTANQTIALPNDSGTLLLDDRPVGSLNGGVSVRGYLPIVAVLASKTLALSDSGTSQVCTATCTITIPTNATVAFAIGTEITILRNTSGTVTLSLTGGVTVTDRNGATNTLTTVTNSALLKKVGTDAWMSVNPVPASVNLPADPTTTTQSAGNNSTRIATTAFVKGEQLTAGNLLVYATQDSAVTLTSGSLVLVPFATEIIDTQNLFSGGSFVPAVTGVYKFSCTLYFTGNLTVYKIALCQGVTEIAIVSLLQIPTTSEIVSSGHVTVQLTAGQTYNIKARGDGSTPAIGVVAIVKNSLMIERLS